MSDYAIEINKVGKKYYIGSLIKRNRTLKAQMGQMLRQPLNRVRSIMSGKVPTHADKELWAIRNFSLNVKQGESVGIIGRNGSGKSTLLQLVAGVVTPTEGEIITRGHIIAMLNVGTGFHPELTGRDNVYINASILGLTIDEIDAIYDDIVEFSEIEDFMDTPLKRYSSGMRVRLAFAVAINVQPEIIILDEVLAVGDPVFREKCLNAIKERYRDTTVLIVSHNIRYLSRICDRMIWMQDGEIIEQGDPDEIVQNYMRLVSSVKPKGAVTKETDEGKQIDLDAATIINPSTGMNTEIINSDLGVKVHLKYTLHIPFEHLRVTCRIFERQMTTLVYETSDSDLEPRHENTRAVGTYEANVILPEFFLTPNKYDIDVMFDDPTTKTVYKVWRTAIEFEVVDNRSQYKAWFDEDRKGFTSLSYEWHYSQPGDEMFDETDLDDGIAVQPLESKEIK